MSMRTLPAAMGAALTMIALSLACGADGRRSADPAATAGGPAAPAAEVAPAASVLELEVTSLEGEPVDLGAYRGKALLIVNTASRCGYTPQYEGLEALWRRYRDRGFVVLGFPSNDFGGQEPGSAKEIRDFCTSKFDVTFPVFAKVHTKGPDQAPIYRILTSDSPAAARGEVRWNFTKFLVDPDGRIVERFEPAVDPLDPELVSAVESVLPG